MITFNDYCRKNFGQKIYKISLDAGFTCPNRDGTKGDKGCIFCSAGGSGDFTYRELSLEEQIEQGKELIRNKYHGNHYIAYFQAFTNTYAPAERLEEIFTPVIKREDIVAISIATRPDCLEKDKIELISELNTIKPVIVELGLQTIHEKTARYIRRGYGLGEYNEAIEKLNEIGIHTVTHVILGLPGESKDEMLQTVEHVLKVKSAGIKLQLLYVLKGTDLEKDYIAERFKTLTLEEYADIVMACLKKIGDRCVVHRYTGDGPRNLLIAPLWSIDKKKVLDYLNKNVLEKL